MNEYSAYDSYDYVEPEAAVTEDNGFLPAPNLNLEDPKIASLPKILFMGPSRCGKTSIQVGSL